MGSATKQEITNINFIETDKGGSSFAQSQLVSVNGETTKLSQSLL